MVASRAPGVSRICGSLAILSAGMSPSILLLNIICKWSRLYRDYGQPGHSLRQQNSRRYSDYIFAEMQDPATSGAVHATVLRDDVLELRLFQANPLAGSTDPAKLRLAFNVDPDSVPPRSSSAPWGYGDPAEQLAAAQALAEGLRAYCLNSTGGLFAARAGDPACTDSPFPYPQGFPNYHTGFEIGLELLATYGVRGDVTIESTGDDGRPVTVSLLGGMAPGPGYVPAPPVRYCSPLPLSSDDRIVTGLDLAEHIQNVGAACTGRRRDPETRAKSGTVAVPGPAPPLLDDTMAEEPKPRPPVEIGPSAAAGDGGRRGLQGQATPGPIGNPLGLGLSDVGVDDGGVWTCYTSFDDPARSPECWSRSAQWYYDSFNASNVYSYAGAVFAAVDVDYSRIAEFWTNPALAAKADRWSMGGSAVAPTLGDAALELRYSVDGTAEHRVSPGCAGAFAPPQGVLAFEYSFKTRLRLWNSSARGLRVWLCNASEVPHYVSLVNVTDSLEAQGVLPLEAGPYLELTVPLTMQITPEVAAEMQGALCAGVYTAVARADERCLSRVAAAVQTGAVVFTWMASSKSHIARTGHLAMLLASSAAFREQFPAVDRRADAVQLSVFARSQRPKLTRDSLLGCVTHYDCDDGLFCSTRALAAYKQGFMGAGGAGSSGRACDLCKYCLSGLHDPYDGKCPQDRCGPKSGSYPSCVDATKLYASSTTCRSTYQLNMSLVPKSSRNIPPDNVIPLWSPNSTVRKARFITPFNQVVGALVITQRRLKGTCPVIDNEFIKRYSATKEPKLGPICRGSEISSSPFGIDPSFSGASSLFRGDISPSQFYSPWEIGDSGEPFGFFPHSYDGMNRTNKSSDLVWGSESSNFKLLFSDRLSGAEAIRLITYMIDGGFIDQLTDEVKVEIVTLNSNLKMFSIFEFTFTWKNGGNIVWDYQIQTVSIELYDKNFQSAHHLVEILCVILLCYQTISEIADMIWAIKTFKLKFYFCDVWNVVDWLHFALMWLGWYCWLVQMRLLSNLVMPSYFVIINSPTANAAARLFLTKPKGEYDYLVFHDALKSLINNMATYNTITSLCVVIFVFRVLKDANFQPRIALITRTIELCIVDLAHFLILFSLVTLGFAVSGVMLFGHQYEAFSTLSNSAFFLIFSLIAFNPDEGWVQMSHAAQAWVYAIFICTWIIIGLFILLNIVLAILIKGYTTAMDIEEAQSASVFRDLLEIFSHEFQRFIKMCWKDYLFLSNDDIVRRLSARMGDSTFDKVLQKYNQIMLVGMTQIKPTVGVAMNAVDVHKILSEFFPELVVALQSKEELYVHPVLRGIMMRYGEAPLSKPPAVLREENSHLFLKRMYLENLSLALRDRLCTYSNAQPDPNSHLPQPPGFQVTNDNGIVPDASRASDEINESEGLSRSYILSVEIKSMRNLPKMDLFRGVDAFCYIFLERSPGLFQTEIRRGLSEADWNWDPELSQPFQWALPADSAQLSPERKLVVMVYDKDQVSSDDLIGCVTISLGELQNGVFDGWRRIIRPPNTWRTKFHFWMPRTAELRLRVNLEQRHHPLEATKRMSLSAGQGQRNNSLPLFAKSLEGFQECKFKTVSTLSFPLKVQLPLKDCSSLPQHQSCDPSLTKSRAGQDLGGKSYQYSQLDSQDNQCFSQDPNCFGCLPPHQVLMLGTVPQRSTLEVQMDDGRRGSINFC